MCMLPIVCSSRTRARRAPAGPKRDEASPVLVLTRKTGQRIRIGEHIVLTVVRAQNGRVRIAINAPRGCRVLRAELTGDDCESGRPGVAESPERAACQA